MQNDGCHLSQRGSDVRPLSSSIRLAEPAVLASARARVSLRGGVDVRRLRPRAAGLASSRSGQRSTPGRAATEPPLIAVGPARAHEGEVMTNMATQVREGPSSAPGARQGLAGQQASLGVWSRDAARRYCSLEGVVTTRGLAATRATTARAARARGCMIGRGRATHTARPASARHVSQQEMRHPGQLAAVLRFARAPLAVPHSSLGRAPCRR